MRLALNLSLSFSPLASPHVLQTVPSFVPCSFTVFPCQDCLYRGDLSCNSAAAAAASIGYYRDPTEPELPLLLSSKSSGTNDLVKSKRYEPGFSLSVSADDAHNALCSDSAATSAAVTAYYPCRSIYPAVVVIVVQQVCT